MARWAIAIHGGAGVDPNLPESRQEEAKRVLARCLKAGVDMLRAGASALDVVEAVVRELETDPFFNSGRGSALTRRGTVEMEASIMDGRGRRCGAVSGVSTVKNPVSLARRVMDKSPHSYLAFDGAEEFAREQVRWPPAAPTNPPGLISRARCCFQHEWCMASLVTMQNHHY